MLHYYIESQKEAVIIDPIFEPTAYLKKLEDRKAKLRYIFLTNWHSDDVNGHINLAKATGA